MIARRKDQAADEAEAIGQRRDSTSPVERGKQYFSRLFRRSQDFPDVNAEIRTDRKRPGEHGSFDRLPSLRARNTLKVDTRRFAVYDGLDSRKSRPFNLSESQPTVKAPEADSDPGDIVMPNHDQQSSSRQVPRHGLGFNRKKRAVTPPPAELRLQLDMSDFDWLPIQEQAEAEPKSNAADKKHTPDMEETTIKEAVAVAVPVPPPPHLARRHVSPAQALVRVTRRHNGDSDSLKKVESERRSWSTTAQKGAVESTSTSPSRDDSLKHADHNIEAALGFPTNPLPDDHHPESYGWYQEHLILESYDTEPWTSVQHLGHGSLGVVDEVRRTATHLPTLVRKRVQLPTQRRMAAKIRAIMQEEAAVLGRLHHPNIITLIGSYEDRTRDKHSVYCLLLHPVGENDLESFLAIASEPDLDTELRDRYQSWIRRWYADLASALMYMHCNGVRHQDIKPSNIIHRGNHVFFTDFSSSGNFKVGQTTSTANPARATAMYASPEVSDTSSTMARHGRPSDVFGLGCVFCDMLTVEGGRTVSAFHDYLLKEENEVRLRYSERSLSILQWLVEIGIYVKPRKLIADMLLRDQELRPSAEGVYDHWKRYERNASQNNRNIVPDEQAPRRPDG